MLRTLHSFVCFQTHFICNASTMHWSSLRWCVHFFLLFTLLQTSVHDARLPLKFADYWQDNSRQADCSWNFIQTLEGWIHRFRESPFCGIRNRKCTVFCLESEKYISGTLHRSSLSCCFKLAPDGQLYGWTSTRGYKRWNQTSEQKEHFDPSSH